MNHALVGSWRSNTSDIPGYAPGCESLHFSQDGNHSWEISQPALPAKPKIIRFKLQETSDGEFLFCTYLQSYDEPVHASWPIAITFMNTDEMILTNHLKNKIHFQRTDRSCAVKA